jgi:uncharacterized RDD family membrane protein YckC
MTEIDPYRPPQTRVEDAPAPGGFPPLATRGQRFRGFLVDLFVNLLIGVAIMFPTIQSLGFEQAMLDLQARHYNYISFLIFIALNGYLLHAHGQTLGKRVVGTRIVRTDGARAGLPRILGLRILAPALLGAVPYAGAVFGLANILFIFREDRRCLHDHIAGTVVVAA